MVIDYVKITILLEWTNQGEWDRRGI